MRPDPREKADLPGEVFRWRGPGGALRLTLLRTPFFAHHDPGVPAKDCPEPVADLGERWFDIALLDEPTNDLAALLGDDAGHVTPAQPSVFRTPLTRRAGRPRQASRTR